MSLTIRGESVAAHSEQEVTRIADAEISRENRITASVKKVHHENTSANAVVRIINLLSARRKEKS
jgi:hypothetical protein